MSHQSSKDLGATAVVRRQLHAPAVPTLPAMPAALTATGDPECITLGRARSELPALRPPVTDGDLGSFGGFRVVRLIGRGGMGAVYEAIDTALGRRVALKLMLPDLTADTDRDRFLCEARATAAVHHENVVRVYTVGEDAGVPYLTMELLRGDTLHARLGVGSLPPTAELLRVGREAALGLAAAHAVGLIHRDVKPGNIWIEEPTGRVKLLDFGLARIGDDASLVGRVGPGSVDLTGTGAVVGTPTHMAPEQASGESLDARTDLFGLGVVLYQMATGRMPFVGDTLAALADATRAGAFTPVGDLAPHVPPELARLVHRLLAPDPADRPASAADAANELFAIGSRPSVEPDAVTRRFAPVPRRRSRAVPLVVAAAVLALVGVAAGAYRLGGRPTTPAPTPAPVAAPAEPTPAPFVKLFNGRDLSGWRLATGSKADAWRVKNGVLTGSTARIDSLLLSDAEYGDYDLRVEYRWGNRGGHTLVMLRAVDQPDFLTDGLSVNLGDDEGFPSARGRTIGQLYQTGTVQGVTHDPPGANRPIGQWNDLEVSVRGSVVEVTLNGVGMPTADATRPFVFEGVSPRSGIDRAAGRIGLLAHFGQIEYRAVEVRPHTK